MKTFFRSVSFFVLALLLSPASVFADNKDLEGKWENVFEASGLKIVSEYTISEKEFKLTALATYQGESTKSTIKSPASLGDKDLMVEEDVNVTKYVGNVPVTTVIFKGRFDHTLSDDKQTLTLSSKKTFYVMQNGREVKIEGINLKMKRKNEPLK